MLLYSLNFSSGDSSTLEEFIEPSSILIDFEKTEFLIGSVFGMNQTYFSNFWFQFLSFSICSVLVSSNSLLNKTKTLYGLYIYGLFYFDYFLNAIWVLFECSNYSQSALIDAPRKKLGDKLEPHGQTKISNSWGPVRAKTNYIQKKTLNEYPSFITCNFSYSYKSCVCTNLCFGT